MEDSLVNGVQGTVVGFIESHRDIYQHVAILVKCKKERKKRYSLIHPPSPQLKQDFQLEGITV